MLVAHPIGHTLRPGAKVVRHGDYPRNAPNPNARLGAFSPDAEAGTGVRGGCRGHADAGARPFGHKLLITARNWTCPP